MFPRMQFAFSGPVVDQEPWGKAFSASMAGHAALVILFLMFSHSKPPEFQTILTEVNFMEREPAPEVREIARGGGESGGGSILGAPGQVSQGASHPEMTNVVPYSSPTGTPNGNVVTAEPMSGPIVALGEIGMIGSKRGSLAPLAGRTEGDASAPSLKTLPTGSVKSGPSQPIALGTQDIGEIRKKEGAFGVPLLKAGLAGGAGTGEGKLKALAGLNTEGRKATLENLKPNPLEKDSWGNKNGPFSMEGPLKYRKILKLELPPYPRWAEEKGIEPVVSYRIWVDPRGRVKETMYLERASGYNELDGLVRESLRRFIFVTLPSDQPQEDEWGVATFRFTFRKQ